jgi:site-specific DNA recombinase
MERFDQRNVSFVSITQQFNTTTSLGRLTLNILLSFAQFEREIIGERTRDKLAAARRKGKWIGGTPPLGYDVAPEGRRLLINDAEATQVRDIFALYSMHEGLIPVVEELNRRGWQTKHWTSRTGRCHPGQPFSKQALLSILKNVTYIGQVRYKGTIYAGEQPPVVEERLWQEVNRRLESQRWPEPQRAGKPALLKGLLRCEPCKAVMILSETRKQGRSYRYYVCANAQRRGWNAWPCAAVSSPAPCRLPESGRWLRPKHPAWAGAPVAAAGSRAGPHTAASSVLSRALARTELTGNALIRPICARAQ